jgi:hypothetical protein
VRRGAGILGERKCKPCPRVHMPPHTQHTPPHTHNTTGEEGQREGTRDDSWITGTTVKKDGRVAGAGGVQCLGYRLTTCKNTVSNEQARESSGPTGGVRRTFSLKWLRMLPASRYWCTHKSTHKLAQVPETMPLAHLPQFPVFMTKAQVVQIGQARSVQPPSHRITPITTTPTPTPTPTTTTHTTPVTHAPISVTPDTHPIHSPGQPRTCQCRDLQGQTGRQTPPGWSPATPAG